MGEIVGDNEKLFQSLLEDNKIEEFLTRLKELSDSNQDFKKWFYLISYMISKIYDVSKEYKDTSLTMDNEIMVYFISKKRLNFIEKIQLDIYNRDFLKLANDIQELKNKEIKDIFDFLNKKLEFQEVCNKNILCDMAVNKQFYEMMKFIKENNLRGLEYSNIKSVLYDIFYYYENQKFPDTAECKCNNLYAAIKSHNFKIAREFSNHKVISSLLDFIIIEKEKIENNENLISNEIGSTVIMDYLLDGEIDMALANVPNYCKNIGKPEYVFLISNTIRIEYLSKSENFPNTLLLLTFINSPLFHVDINDYLAMYDSFLKENNFLVAKYVKRIIMGITNLDNNIDSLQIERKIQSIYDKNFFGFIALFEKEDKYLKKEKGISLLKFDNSNCFEEMISELKKYNNIIAICPNFFDKNVIILKYYEKDVESNNELYKKAMVCFSERKYDEALVLLKNVLLYVSRGYIYAMIAACYYAQKNYLKAIEYYTVATYFEHSKENRDNLFEKIYRIEAKMNGDEYKNEIDINEINFEDSSTKNNINLDLVLCLMEEYDCDLNAAIKMANLSCDDECGVLFVFAEEWYKNGEIEYGDMLLRQVEGIKGKSKEINQKLQEIRKQRNFYKNRAKEDKIQLLLKKKSKK